MAATLFHGTPPDRVHVRIGPDRIRYGIVPALVTAPVDRLGFRILSRQALRADEVLLRLRTVCRGWNEGRRGRETRRTRGVSRCAGARARIGTVRRIRRVRRVAAAAVAPVNLIVLKAGSICIWRRARSIRLIGGGAAAAAAAAVRWPGSDVRGGAAVTLGSHRIRRTRRFRSSTAYRPGLADQRTRRRR